MKRYLLPLLLVLPACTSTDAPEPPKPAATGEKQAPAVFKGITLTAPFVVTGTFDGQGKAYRADPKKLGDGSQKEGQKPLFILRPGATIKNVVIDHPAADGIHVETAKGKKNYVLNVTWKRVGEDAATVYGNGEVRFAGCEFYEAVDKCIQVNGPAKVVVDDCRAENFRTFARGCGTCPNQPYDITVKNLTARNGGNIIRLTNSKGRGAIIGGKFTNIQQPAYATGGAKIEMR